MVGDSLAEETREGELRSVPSFRAMKHMAAKGGWVFSHSYHSLRERLTYYKYTKKINNTQ